MSSVYCIEMYLECINSVLFVKVITLIHKNIRHKYQVILLLFYICYKEIPKKGKKILMAKICITCTLVLSFKQIYTLIL